MNVNHRKIGERGGTGMQYWMLRLFLTSRERPALLQQMEPAYRPKTRQEFLLETFREDIVFRHYGDNYVYKFFSEPLPGAIAAVIAREHVVTIALPPSQQFQGRDVPDWETANVFIDTSSDFEGQKVAMHAVGIVGNPVSVMRSLTDHINRSGRATDWVIAVNAISREEDFWAAAERHRGHITEIDMVFATPNIWGGETETENALRSLHGENNAQEVEVKLKNSDQKINPFSETIRRSIDYITKGGGKVLLRRGNRKLYDSENTAVTETPEEDDKIQNAAPDLLRRLVAVLFRK
jgi:hypothetical protein